ncbi:hypothetical protein NDU88_007726 [Pleurodeles waltl]|uniref:Uncharacterized protein n=1 Tax=Pleurodeles waltl TaxID=8319 RepID=A0AAV7VQJ7_PLEWA|nr:hypothetical protein NDU88_007726 [Pleurodeles waltl]
MEEGGHGPHLRTPPGRKVGGCHHILCEEGCQQRESRRPKTKLVSAVALPAKIILGPWTTSWGSAKKVRPGSGEGGPGTHPGAPMKQEKRREYHHTPSRQPVRPHINARLPAGRPAPQPYRDVRAMRGASGSGILELLRQHHLPERGVRVGPDTPTNEGSQGWAPRAALR